MTGRIWPSIKKSKPSCDFGCSPRVGQDMVNHFTLLQLAGSPIIAWSCLASSCRVPQTVAAVWCRRLSCQTGIFILQVTPRSVIFCSDAQAAIQKAAFASLESAFVDTREQGAKAMVRVLSAGSPVAVGLGRSPRVHMACFRQWLIGIFFPPSHPPHCRYKVLVSYTLQVPVP